MRVVNSFGPVIGAALALVLAGGVASANTLQTVKERGELVCGVAESLPGFSAPDSEGKWSGFDVDLCRAIAAAIFDDADKVSFVPLSAGDRIAALQSEKIDILSRNSTWTLSREADLGLLFAGVTYYDGQGFLIRRTLDHTSALELDNTKICVQRGTTTELNVVDYFNENKMRHEIVSFERVGDMMKAYDDGQCDVFTSDVSQLYAQRLSLSAPDEHMILPDIISKEPLGPAVRQGDEQWFNIVKWVHFAMINARSAYGSAPAFCSSMSTVVRLNHRGRTDRQE
jgi:general L-amino acid transport system substrate-binding protein